MASAGWGPSVSIWQLEPITDDVGRTEISPSGGPSAYDAASGARARVQGDRLDVTVAGGDAPPGHGRTRSTGSSSWPAAPAS